MEKEVYISLTYYDCNEESGNVEKSHQQRSHHLAVLTYWKYARRVKMAVALLGDFFDYSRQLLTTQFPAALALDL